jgi:flagellar hook assembly protein FlgD
VKLEVFNLMGQRVLNLVQKTQPAGLHRVFWNGRNQTGTQSPNGVYFYRIDAVYDKGRFADMKKMILLR